MKKSVLFFLILLLCLSIFAAQTPEYYDSSYMLDNYYFERGNRGFSDSYLENTKISIFCVESGDVLYQWFGHLGILVESEGYREIMYDYGRFEFGPDFYANFAMGRLWYKCMASYAAYDLSVAVEDNRSVWKKELDLTNEQKAALLSFLNINSSNAYNTYLYHNYRDNCSTRIRDIFDCMTGGEFRKWAESRGDLTYRERTNTVLSRSVPILWILDFFQGRNIDLPQSYWDNMFLPSVFFSALDEYEGKLSDKVGGTEFVYEKTEDSTRPSYSEEVLDYTLVSVLAALCAGALSFVFITLGKKSRVIKVLGGTYGFLIHFCLGVLGSLLFFMMFFTLHDYTFLNENILFVNPLLLVLAFLSFRPQKHRRALVFFYRLFCTFIILLLLGKLLFPSYLIQKNMPQLLSLLVFYVCNLAALRKS